MIQIDFPDFPTKVQTTKGRRKQYYNQGDVIPKKYQNALFGYKGNKLWDRTKREWVIKNALSLDKPRFQPLSYNKVGTRQKMLVLKLLKEYMVKYLPKPQKIGTPCMIQCIIYDRPLPLTKDLDNMHIYYKAFLDLLVEKGYLEDDSKQFVTASGGFTYVPVDSVEERLMTFIIEDDNRDVIKGHLMYQSSLPVLSMSSSVLGRVLVESTDVGPGCIHVGEVKIFACFGKTKPTKADTHRVFRKIYEVCMNTNTRLCMSRELHKKFQPQAEWLLSEKIPITIMSKV